MRGKRAEEDRHVDKVTDTMLVASMISRVQKTQLGLMRCGGLLLISKKNTGFERSIEKSTIQVMNDQEIGRAHV